MRARKKLLLPAALIAWLFLPAEIRAVEAGTPSGRKGVFAAEATSVRGDYSAAPSPSVWISSAALAPAALAGGTTSHYADISIIPGNTFYYYFAVQSGYEQKNPAYRSVYVSSGSPGYILVDGVLWPSGGLIESATIWHNWAGAPPPPVNLTSFWSSGNDYVSLSWDNPLFEGSSLLDLTGGGGYEIYRSSVSFDEAMIFVSSLSAVSGQLSYNDFSVLQGASYYYNLRAYDAYVPPLFSSAAATSPESRRTYVTVRFNLDATDAGQVLSAALVGDFTPSLFYPGRLDMDYAGGGRWRVEYSDVNLYDGALIRYKYLVNGLTYESDIPEALGGPFRTVTVRDEGGGRMTINNFWSVWTPTSSPSNLPEVLVGFSAAAGNNRVVLEWDYDPLSTGTISGYALYRATVNADYTLLASSDALSPSDGSFSDDSALNGTTYYYRIASIGLSGIQSQLSDNVTAVPPSEGSRVPSYPEASAARFLPGDFSGERGAATGSVLLGWKAAAEDPSLGPAASYVVKYASFPITGAQEFISAKVAGVVRGRGKNSRHTVFTLNLGENNPGYYFAVCAVYGLWQQVSFSTSVVVTAPKVFDASQGVSAAKGTRYFGGSSTAAPVALLEIPPGAFPGGVYAAVVRNFSELSADAGYRALIKSADETALSDGRFGRVERNSQTGSSSIFSFEVFDPSGGDYFSAESGRSSRRDIRVSLSYDGLDVAPEDLVVARLNEKNGFWRVLKDIKPEIDRARKLIKFNTRNLSVYSLVRTGAPADDLSGVVVYPNPFKPHDGKYETGDYSTGIKFANLTRNARVYIYNIAGELVRHGGLEADGYGDCRWDGKNEDGRYAASGVYIFVVKDESVTQGKNKFTGRLGIVR